jgi:transposase
MIAFRASVRVWLAVGRTDMRRGMTSLALQVQEALGRDPHGGDLYVFRGARGDLIKILWHDGVDMSLYANYLASYCVSFTLIRGLCYCPVTEPVPSTAVLDRWLGPRCLIQVRMGVVGVSRYETMLHPSDERGFVDSEACRGFGFRQHSLVSQAVVSGAEPVLVGEIGDAQ